MQSQAIRKIRATGFSKINQLVRAARYYKELRPAFAEWVAGDIYVCKKTGTYRYRFGKRGKSVTQRWRRRSRRNKPRLQHRAPTSFNWRKPPNE